MCNWFLPFLVYILHALFLLDGTYYGHYKIIKKKKTNFQIMWLQIYNH